MRACKAYTSLAVLNAGQAALFTVGLGAAMVLCVVGIRAGTNTVGDFVMINAMMIQLYQPLNFMGMVYREIKQAVTDIELMFSILAREPEIEDAPAPSRLRFARGDPLRERAICLRARAANPERLELRGAGRPHRGDRRSLGSRASRPSRGCCSVSMT
jgi:ATP-binding cassette subfamily B protein